MSRRALFCLVTVSLFTPVLVIAKRSIEAELHFTQVHAWIPTNTLQAFLAANEAYKAQPLNGQYRMQLQLSLSSLMATRDNVTLSPKAADRVFEVASSSSPFHPLVLVNRAQYLFNAGRWKETGWIIDRLQKTAKTYPQTWMVTAVWHGRNGNQQKAAEAIGKGLDAGGELTDMRRVAHSINMEIVEQ